MRMRWLLSILFCFGFIFLLFACAQNEAMRTSNQDASPEIVAKWETGKHGQVNVGCFVCHGEEEFFATPQGERCSGCHSAQEVNFAALPVKNCFGCHGGHDLKFHKAD